MTLPQSISNFRAGKTDKLYGIFHDSISYITDTESVMMQEMIEALFLHAEVFGEGPDLLHVASIRRYLTVPIFDDPDAEGIWTLAA